MGQGKYIRTDEIRKKASEALKGKKHSKERKRKISEALIGIKHTEYTKALMSKAKKGLKVPLLSGENSSSWKGEDVGYSALHRWKRKISGHPQFCKKCGKRGEYIVYFRQGRAVRRWNIDWASKSREYRRDLNDWIGLCRPCHTKYDERGFPKGHTINNRRVPWNKKWLQT
jgi:hypothetical protein